MASKFPDEGRSASEGGDDYAELPFRTDGSDRPARTEARAELRDRETYYAELRFAVHCQSRSNPSPPSPPSFPAPRAALDDQGSDTFGNNGVFGDDSTEGESWDDMIARFDDTWT